MAAAEHLDAQLRAGIRSARSGGVRCFKAVVRSGAAGEGEDGARCGRALALGASAREDAAATLEQEFSRCCKELVEDAAPCLLLFRADGRDNIASSRWLLVVWLPDVASEADRVVYVRSRGLLSHVVAQPYFLQEFFASSRTDLKWSLASRTDKALARSCFPGEPATALVGTNETSSPNGPVVCAPGVAALLQRFGAREEPCIRLQLSLVRKGMKWSGRLDDSPPGLLALDARSYDCKNAATLAKSALPSSMCYIATTTAKEDLLFVMWCPDIGLKKDAVRVFEEARYAVMKLMIMKMVADAFPVKPERVIQLDARDPQEIHDGVVKATDTSVMGRSASRSTQPEREWPAPGACADWPAEWPASALAVSVPSTLALYTRPVPIWRGGSKAHSIVAADAHTSTRAKKSGRVARPEM